MTLKATGQKAWVQRVNALSTMAKKVVFWKIVYQSGNL